MKILVTYQSKTGFTKKYAEWISEELNCDLMDISQVNSEVIAKYELIIHGGWIMGGMINGLDKIRNFNPQKVVAFGVGLTKKEEVETTKIIEANKLENIPFFYFEGGTNPEKMGFISKIIIKMVTKEKPTFKDNTNKNDIKSLIKLVNGFKNE